MWEPQGSTLETMGNKAKTNTLWRPRQHGSFSRLWVPQILGLSNSRDILQICWFLFRSLCFLKHMSQILAAECQDFVLLDVSAFCVQGHVARDLSKLMRRSPLESALEHVLLPVQLGNHVVYEEHYILLPHKWWAHMHAYDEGLFLQQLLGGNSANASRFWKQMQGTILQSKLDKLKLDPKKTIPLKIFGDGIACTGLGKSWSKSAEAILIASLLPAGNSRSSEVLQGDLKKTSYPRQAELNWVGVREVGNLFDYLVKWCISSKSISPEVMMALLWKNRVTKEGMRSWARFPNMGRDHPQIKKKTSKGK